MSHKLELYLRVSHTVVLQSAWLNDCRGPKHTHAHTHTCTHSILWCLKSLEAETPHVSGTASVCKLCVPSYTFESLDYWWYLVQCMQNVNSCYTLLFRKSRQEKSLNIFSKVVILKNYFNTQLVRFVDMEPLHTVAQVWRQVWWWFSVRQKVPTSPALT